MADSLLVRGKPAERGARRDSGSPAAARHEALERRPAAAPIQHHARLLSGRSDPLQPVQLKKKKDGVEYAESETEARELMEAYAAKSEVVPSPSALTAAISVAANPTLGLREAEKIIDQELIDSRSAENQKKRKEAHADDYAVLKDQATDDLSSSALEEAYDRYVKNPMQPNITLGKTYTQSEVNAGLKVWKALNGWADGVTFWGYAGQDKAALGKGNVGDTLAKRGVQANFLCKWSGKTINVHIDIKG